MPESYNSPVDYVQGDKYSTTTTTYQFKERTNNPRKRKLPSGLTPYQLHSDEDSYGEAPDDHCSSLDETSSEDMGDSGNESSGVTDNRGRHERQLMRPWLIDQVMKGDVIGLEFLDDAKTLIKVPWTHASRHGWDAGRDSSLFKLWALHTGKYKPGEENPDSCPKRWKANFRCAMNSLPDVTEEKAQTQKKGHNAFKVYRLHEEKKRGGTKLSKKAGQSSESEGEQQYKRYQTKADRLERHRVIKQLRKKVKGTKCNDAQVQNNAVTSSDKQSTMTIPPVVTKEEKQDTYNYHTSAYSSTDNQTSTYHSQEDRKPMVIPKCAEPSWDSVEAEEVVRTTGSPNLVHDYSISSTTTKSYFENEPKNGEHSYARDTEGSGIPSFVADEKDDSSDRSSISDTSAQELEHLAQLFDVTKGIIYTEEPETPTAYTYYNSTQDLFSRPDGVDYSFSNNTNNNAAYSATFSVAQAQHVSQNNNSIYHNATNQSYLEQLVEPTSMARTFREVTYNNY